MIARGKRDRKKEEERKKGRQKNIRLLIHPHTSARTRAIPSQKQGAETQCICPVHAAGSQGSKYMGVHCCATPTPHGIEFTGATIRTWSQELNACFMMWDIGIQVLI